MIHRINFLVKQQYSRQSCHGTGNRQRIGQRPAGLTETNFQTGLQHYVPIQPHNQSGEWLYSLASNTNSTGIESELSVQIWEQYFKCVWFLFC